METIAPLAYAEAWDNVGLLVGDRNASVSHVWLTIDATVAEMHRAHQTGCDAMMAYHPVIFKGVRRLGPSDPSFVAARLGLHVYSPHTALDVAQGGTNDCLAEAAGLTRVRPLRMRYDAQTDTTCVVFVPQEAVEKVSQAMFHAGAGRIGEYTQCSFKTLGEGTFYGGEKTSPSVGQKQRLERVPEIRLEMRVPLKRVGSVLEAMRAAHPYETPAYDFFTHAPQPSVVGLGRLGEVSSCTPQAWTQQLCERLRVARVQCAWPEGMDVLQGLVAVCAGAGGDMVEDVLGSNARMFLTGELRHHDVLRLLSRGVAVCCTEHAVSEYGVLYAVQNRLETLLPGLRCTVTPTAPGLFV